MDNLATILGGLQMGGMPVAAVVVGYLAFKFGKMDKDGWTPDASFTSRWLVPFLWILFGGFAGMSLRRVTAAYSSQHDWLVTYDRFVIPFFITLFILAAAGFGLRRMPKLQGD